MAWKAAITGWDLDTPSITVGYYDDTDPLNADGTIPYLYSQRFSRAEITSDAELVAQVKQKGKQLRTVYQRVQAIKAAGAITIP
jgi:hypothetical protein